jgi:hypothetical protein
VVVSEPDGHAEQTQSHERRLCSRIGAGICPAQHPGHGAAHQLGCVGIADNVARICRRKRRCNGAEAPRPHQVVSGRKQRVRDVVDNHAGCESDGCIATVAEKLQRLARPRQGARTPQEKPAGALCRGAAAMEVRDAQRERHDGIHDVASAPLQCVVR